MLEGSRREALSVIVWRGLFSFLGRSVGMRQIEEQVKVEVKVKKPKSVSFYLYLYLYLSFPCFFLQKLTFVSP